MFSSKTAVAIAALLAAAEAVKVTSPAKGAEWDLSKTNEITWDSVDTDPKSFEIVIVNQSAYPETSETVATVNTADGKYELKGAKVPAGSNYRINLVSTDPQNSGILAQSQEFALTGDSTDDKTASASATASGSSASSASGSATASATGASASSGSATGSAATASATKTASGLTTVTTGTATASASGTDASASGTASHTATGSAATGSAATGSAASGSSTSAPSSASAVKSTFAIFGSVALAAYMFF